MKLIDCIYEVFIIFQYVLHGNNMTDFQNFSFLTHTSSEFSFQTHSYVWQQSVSPIPKPRSLDLSLYLVTFLTNE